MRIKEEKYRRGRCREKRIIHLKERDRNREMKTRKKEREKEEGNI